MTRTYPKKPCPVCGVMIHDRSQTCLAHRGVLGRDARFWSYVDASGSCWEWTGGKRTGYGHFSTGKGRDWQAHRYAWTSLVGPLSAELTLDHLCRNRACVNPDHLEPVSLSENVLRGFAPTIAARKRDKCPRGHAFDSGNTYIASRNRRICRACSRDRQAAHRAKGRAAA